MRMVAKSDLSTGNKYYASYVLQSNELILAFTAPYKNTAEDRIDSNVPMASFNQDESHQFIEKHGLAVRAVTIIVDDATVAYNVSTANGAVGILEPTTIIDKTTNESSIVSETKLFGDTVIRWLSGNFKGPFLPNYENVASPDISFGIRRIDHCVSNVPKLFEAVDYLMGYTGFHEFSEFTAADVGTVDSGLNSMVLANNNEYVLLPVNEPTFGTPRKSQIQTYLEHNNGAGVQHIALKTDDIFLTMKEMRNRSYCGGFEFMPAPGPEYYKRIPSRIGADGLTAQQIEELERLGLLVDRDDQGILLQVFTKPLGDRPTVFIEIIQRIGCDKTPSGEMKEQTAGCGGFGKGNFSELFKSIEEFEKQMEKK